MSLNNERRVSEGYREKENTAFFARKTSGEKSHYYLPVALNSLFVETGLLSEELTSEFHDAMILREDADYHGNFTKEGAETVLKAAKEFLATAKSILKIK